MSVSFKTPSTAAAVAIAMFALAGCDNALPGSAKHVAPPASATPAANVASAQPTMQNGAEAIKACMANGLSEATCAQVYHDMMAGRPPQGASTFAECEAKYGAGQCGANPVPNASGTGNVFLPLVAGAALGALGGYLLSKNLAPKGAYVPPTDWLKNRPSISAPQNPVASGARSSSVYAQAPGNYSQGAAKVGGVDAKTTQFGTPNAAKSGVAPVPGSASSGYQQTTPASPYATQPRYGNGSGYTYKSAPTTPRPGARSYGRRR